MTTTQKPLGSGFNSTSTADDVLQGLDLTGKLAIVTGGFSGIGLEMTRSLSRAGASIIVPTRRPDDARAAVAGIDRVEVVPMDLGDLDSVKDFADNFLTSGRKIDYLLCNAGIMANPETRVGPGWESQFATNHLGHFAMVNRLWSAVNAGARVVMTSSGGHGGSGIRWGDIHFEGGYDRWLAYSQSKTANVLFAVELDKRGRDAGVRALATHPGVIITPLQRHVSHDDQVRLGWIDAEGNPNPDFKAPQQGAATQVWGAVSPQLDDMGGVYLVDCDVAEESVVKEWARDPDEAAKLWDYSAKVTGVNAFA